MFRVWITNSSEINGIRVCWVNDYAVDISCFLKPHFFPCFTRIHTFINSFTDIEGIAGIAFTGSCPNNIGISLLNGHRTNILCRLFIKYGCPGVAAIDGLPYSARGGTEINDVGIVNHNVN